MGPHDEAIDAATESLDWASQPSTSDGTAAATASSRWRTANPIG